MTQAMKLRPLFPANVNADLGHFKDKDRQENVAKTLEEELSQAPWQKETANGPLDDLEKVTKTVRPIYDGFWHDRDQDIISRLDLAAQGSSRKREQPSFKTTRKVTQDSRTPPALTRAAPSVMSP